MIFTKRYLIPVWYQRSIKCLFAKFEIKTSTCRTFVCNCSDLSIMFFRIRSRVKRDCPYVGILLFSFHFYSTDFVHLPEKLSTKKWFPKSFGIYLTTFSDGTTKDSQHSLAIKKLTSSFSPSLILGLLSFRKFENLPSWLVFFSLNQVVK